MYFVELAAKIATGADPFAEETKMRAAEIAASPSCGA